MTGLFLKIVNMSITASILVLLVLVLRLIFKKAPKWVNVLLWGLVAVRLICPFTVESPFSLMPKTDWIEQADYEGDRYFNSILLHLRTADHGNYRCYHYGNYCYIKPSSCSCIKVLRKNG